jgi:hypothetical protein
VVCLSHWTGLTEQATILVTILYGISSCITCSAKPNTLYFVCTIANLIYQMGCISKLVLSILRMKILESCNCTVPCMYVSLPNLLILKLETFMFLCALAGALSKEPHWVPLIVPDSNIYSKSSVETFGRWYRTKWYSITYQSGWWCAHMDCCFFDCLTAILDRTATYKFRQFCCAFVWAVFTRGTIWECGEHFFLFAETHQRTQEWNRWSPQWFSLVNQYRGISETDR